MSLSIGEASKASKLPVKTIRYYEDIGLISPPRQDNGYRFYRDKELHKLKFVQRTRSLGFSIEDCRVLLSLYEDEQRSSASVKTIAEKHLVDIDQKLLELHELRDVLSDLIDHCAGDHRPDCPILDNLAEESN